MLPPEPFVLDGRQALLDAQSAFTGTSVVRGFYNVCWYGTVTSDERGCFGVVDPTLALADCVGDVLEVVYYPTLVREFSVRSIRVYVIGSQQDLGSELGITRRCYMTLEHLAIEPILASIGVVS